jgi:hypothetical protein
MNLHPECCRWHPTLVSDADIGEVKAEQLAAGIALAQHYVAEALRLFEASHVSDVLRQAEQLRS